MGEESTRADDDPASAGSRRTVAQMVVVGVDRVGARHRARARRSTGSRRRRRRRPSTIDTLWDVLIIVSVPVFVLVTTVVLFAVWKFRMRPGEEHAGRAADPRQHAARGHLDRDPRDHPRRACTYAYVVLHDIEKAPAAGDERASRSSASSSPGRSTTTRPAARSSPRRQLYVPEGQSVKFDVAVQGRPARLLGPGLPDEDRRRPGHHDALPGHADQGSAPTRSSAPSSAASATPSCARPRTSCPSRSSTPGCRR